MVPSAHVGVIRAVTALMYIFSFLLHLQFSPAFRRKLCFSVPKSLKQPGKKQQLQVQTTMEAHFKGNMLAKGVKVKPFPGKKTAM